MSHGRCPQMPLQATALDANVLEGNAGTTTLALPVKIDHLPAPGQTASVAYRIADGNGMYLEVMPTGAKYWRMKFRIAGKEKRLAFGVYPEVSLAEARSRRDEARKLLAMGRDPSLARRANKLAGTTKAANSFEVIAREWLEKFSTHWVPSHADRIVRRLERDIFPWLGDRPIAEVTSPELLSVLRRIENRGALETAHRAHQNCGQIFRYAVATGRAAHE